MTVEQPLTRPIREVTLGMLLLGSTSQWKATPRFRKLRFETMVVRIYD